MIPKPKQNARETTKKSLHKDKRFSIKNGRHVNPRPLSKRIFPFLPDTPQELFNHLARYYNRTQWLAVVIFLKEYRRLLSNNEKCATFELTNKIISERMGLKGISMIPEYTNKNEDFGIVFKRYRCQDREAYLPNIYRVHTCFEDPAFLEAFIKLINDSLRSNTLPRLLKQVGGIIISANSVLISICKRGFGRMLDKKSTHSSKQINRERQDKKVEPTKGKSISFCNKEHDYILQDYNQQRLFDNEFESDHVERDILGLSCIDNFEMPVRKLRIDDSDVRVKSMMPLFFSSRIKEEYSARFISQEEYEELDRIFSGCNA